MKQELPERNCVLRKKKDGTHTDKHPDSPAKWQTATEGYRLSSMDNSSFFSWLFQARFIGQSLGANWLVEPLDHMVPLSIPERCHPAAAYAQLASSVVAVGGGRCVAAAGGSGSRRLPGDTSGDGAQPHFSQGHQKYPALSL